MTDFVVVLFAVLSDEMDKLTPRQKELIPRVCGFLIVVLFFIIVTTVGYLAEQTK